MICYTGYMHEGLHHVIRRTRTKHERGNIVSLMDRMAYLMGIVTVLVNIPQLVAIWTSPDTQGVSLISWIGFFLGSCFWVIYGLLHKERPIIVMNAALMVVQGCIVIGILTK